VVEYQELLTSLSYHIYDLEVNRLIFLFECCKMLLG